MYEKEYHFRSDPHQARQRPITIVILCQLTKRGNLSAKDVIGDKENAQDAKRNFLKQCRKGASPLRIARLEPEKAN